MENNSELLPRAKVIATFCQGPFRIVHTGEYYRLLDKNSLPVADISRPYGRERAEVFCAALNSYFSRSAETATAAARE